MNNQNEIDLVIKHGYFTFESANLTDLTECDPHFCDSIQYEINEVCSQDGRGNDRVITRQPDGTICYCRCR